MLARLSHWSASITLLAQAAHMLADSAASRLAIVAIHVGRRARERGSHVRQAAVPTIAIYTNGLRLRALTAWIAEASRRSIAPAQSAN